MKSPVAKGQLAWDKNGCHPRNIAVHNGSIKPTDSDWKENEGQMKRGNAASHQLTGQATIQWKCGKTSHERFAIGLSGVLIQLSPKPNMI